MKCQKICYFSLVSLETSASLPTKTKWKTKLIFVFRLSIIRRLCRRRPLMPNKLESRDNAREFHWRTEQSLQNKKANRICVHSKQKWQLINDDRFHDFECWQRVSFFSVFSRSVFAFNCHYHCSCNFLLFFSSHIIAEKWHINHFFSLQLCFRWKICLILLFSLSLFHVFVWRYWCSTLVCEFYQC